TLEGDALNIYAGNPNAQNSWVLDHRLHVNLASDISAQSADGMLVKVVCGRDGIYVLDRTSPARILKIRGSGPVDIVAVSDLFPLPESWIPPANLPRFTFSSNAALSIDDEENLYIAPRETNQIWRLSPDGTLKRMAGVAQSDNLPVAESADADM